jgi:hypothetical protein
MTLPTLGYTIAGASTASTQPLPVQNTQASLTADFIALYSGAGLNTVAINLANLLGISSQVVSINDPQTLTQKTLDNTNSYTSKDTSFTLQNAASTTKRAQFLLSGITAGNTRIFTLPDYNATLATIAGTETLTGKTLTAPVTTAIVNTGGLSTDTITASGNVTIAGTLGVTGLPTIFGSTAPPAGGSNATGVRLSSTANFGIFFGSGVPTLNAGKGSFYMRTDGSSTSTRAYINTDGASTWTAVTTAA